MGESSSAKPGWLAVLRQRQRRAIHPSQPSRVPDLERREHFRVL